MAKKKVSKKSKSKKYVAPTKFLHLSFITAIIAVAGSISLFYLNSEQTATGLVMFLLPLFVMAALIFSVIDFVLIVEHPRLRRKLPPILAIILGVLAFTLYIIGLGRLA